MNDRERSLWIVNDQGLYNWWKGSRLSHTAFIAQNRKELTACINRAMAPKPKTWRNY